MVSVGSGPGMAALMNEFHAELKYGKSGVIFSPQLLESLMTNGS